MLDSLFNKVVGLQTSNFIKKVAPTQEFSCECCEFFKQLCPWNTSGGCFYVYSKGKKREAWNKGVRKKCSNESISFNFYLQVLVLVKTNANTKCSPFFFVLFLQIFFHVYSFFVFSFLTNGKISLVAFISIFRSRHWELFCKTAVWQDITKAVNFFTELELALVQFTK